MDNKGVISIEYLFSLFLVIIIALGMLFYASSTIQSTLNIEDSMAHKLILDSVANAIIKVNSKGEGYSKVIDLPSDVGYYEITVSKNRLVMEYSDRKGEAILPLVNMDSTYRLISGRQYHVLKASDGKIVIT